MLRLTSLSDCQGRLQLAPATRDVGPRGWLHRQGQLDEEVRKGRRRGGKESPSWESEPEEEETRSR